ncbi:MAG: FHA domain-containing protein [Acidobacteria bacterium]|nr:FHA domain-containing protein [Acidobacteriota bacterium]
MLFKKKKKAQMITLGLADSTAARQAEHASRPPVAPMAEEVPEPVRTEIEPASAAVAPPEEIAASETPPPEPVAAEIPAADEPPVAADSLPPLPVVSAPGDREDASAEERVFERVLPGESREDGAALQTVSVTSGLPLGERAEEIPTRQCPFCLTYVRLDEGRCEACGNLLDKDLSGPLPVPPAAAEAESTAEDAGIVATADAPETPLDVEMDGLNDTKAMAESPVPSVLKDTKILLPAVLKLFGRKSDGKAAFTVNIGRTAIGRDQDNDLSFPDEEFISRHHCEIVYQKYQYVLQDAGSANGTFVNDVKVRETVLRDGDVIQIGPLRFLFEDPVEKMKKLETRYAETGDDPAGEDANQN